MQKIKHFFPFALAALVGFALPSFAAYNLPGPPYVGPNGSAAAPSYSFSGHAGDGMLSTGAGNLSWATNGVSQMTLSSGGTLSTGGLLSSSLLASTNNGVIQTGAGGVFGLCPGASGNALADTGFSRGFAPGVSVFGNGTPGDFSGRIQSGFASIGSGTQTQAMRTTSVDATWNAPGVVMGPLIYANAIDTASASGSLLMDLQKGSVSQLNISKTGALTVGGPGSIALTGGGNLYFASATVGSLYWNNATQVQCPADGQVTLTNWAANGWGRINLGGTTNAFPSVARVGSYTTVELADGSAGGGLAPLSAGTTDLGAGTNGFKRLYLDYTNTATVGAVTINKAVGRVNVAAAGTSVVVTDSLVTASSHVICVVSQADATAYVRNVVPAAGSFTITLGAAATAQTSIDFLVINAD